MALNILVTGANGVLGNALVEELRAAHYEVLATGRNATVGIDARWDVAQDDAPQTTFQPDVVIHNAALTGRLSHSLEFAANLFQVNVEGTRRVAAWCARENIGQVVYISGALVYGSWETPRREDEMPEPWRAGAYAVTKFCGEQVIRQLEQEKALVTIVRPSSLIGASYENHLIERFAEQGVRGRIDLSAPFEDAFDLLHVSDAARTIRFAIEKRAKGIWNLGGGELTTLEQLAKLCAAATQAQVFMNAEPPARPRRILNWVQDKAAREFLGHTNQVTLTDTVAEITQRVRVRG